jgi:hypothetical protein
MRNANIFATLVLATTCTLFAQQQDTTQQPKPDSAGHDVGAGTGDVAKGAGGAAGNVAEGTGKGVADVATLHPVKGGEAVGKGVGKGAEDAGKGAVKGTGKVAEGTGKGIGHIFHHKPKDATEPEKNQ